MSLPTDPAANLAAEAKRTAAKTIRPVSDTFEIHARTATSKGAKREQPRHSNHH